MKSITRLLAASALVADGSVQAADLEVTHWWTSGGEAAAVAEFAQAFNATDHNWVDGAIAGSGGTARPIIGAFHSKVIRIHRTHNAREQHARRGS